jgi:hypothetical protein
VEALEALLPWNAKLALGASKQQSAPRSAAA